MNPRIRQLLCVLAILAGISCFVWGFNHFTDPIVLRDYKGYPLPGKRQYEVLIAGAFLIYGGFLYIKQSRLPLVSAARLRTYFPL